MATLKDIAKNTGFSLSVVSRALNPKPDQQVAPDTKARIEQAMRDLNYRRNHAASLLARGKNAGIGVFLPGYGYSLIADLVIGISEAAACHDFQCSFYFGLDKRDYLRFLNSVETAGNAGILSYMPDGEFSHGELSRAIAGFREQGGKMLLLNSSGLPEIGMESVNIDNHAGGRIAAEHLLNCGCDDYLCLSTPKAWQTEQRYAGFADALTQRGLSPRIAYIHSSGFHQYREAEIKLLLSESARRRVGIFAVSDFLAMEIIRSFSQLGFQEELGRNIRIIGYDNTPGSQYVLPALTTVNQPFRELGHCGMATLLSMITGMDYRQNPVPLPQLIVRESA